MSILRKIQRYLSQNRNEKLQPLFMNDINKEINLLKREVSYLKKKVGQLETQIPKRMPTRHIYGQDKK